MGHFAGRTGAGPRGAGEVAALELDLLGGFELRGADGSPLNLSSKKAKALLAFLALSPERTVSRDKVAALLWPASGDEHARSSLRQTLAQLRRMMADAGGPVVLSSGQGLRVDPERLRVDVTMFEAGLAEDDGEFLERAVAAYKGPLMDGLEIRAEPFEEWLRGERARLGELAAKAMGSLMEACQADGMHEAALSMAKNILRLDSLREDVHRWIMRFFRERKRWNEALRQYEDCQTVLRAELGIAPEEATQALYRDILHQRDAVEKHRPHAKAEKGSGKTPSPAQLGDEGKPSIAILPFENLSGDPEQSYFSEGITEDIITELSRFAELFVIARNTTFAYKDRAVSFQDVRRDLGVQYVVNGSVRKSGNRVRLTAQLIETESGKHIWANRYDRELTDVFELQDDLTRGIVAVLPGRVENYEARKIARTLPDDMAAYELLLAAKNHHHLFTKEDNHMAFDLLDRALALDPNYAAAHAWKACLLGQAIGRGFLPAPPKTLVQEATKAVEKALSLDENEVEGHRILGEIFLESRRWEEAAQHNERALSLNPNDPRLAAQKGELLTWTGHAEEGETWIRMAMCLDPYSAPVWAHLLGRALMLAGNYAEAVEAYAKSSYPRFGYHADMAGCYAAMGMNGEAEKQARLVTEMKPNFSTASYIERLVYKDEASRERHRELLQAAPLPP